MPSRCVSSPSRSEKKTQSSGIPKKKKSGQRTKSASESPASLNLTTNSLAQTHGQSELASALVTQNGNDSPSLLTARFGRATSGANQSLSSTLHGDSQGLLSPIAMAGLISPEHDSLPAAHPHGFFEAAPKLSATHSNATSLFCTPASMSLPNAYKDPTRVSEPRAGQPLAKKSMSADNLHGRADGSSGFILKKPPPRRAVESQPPMFNTSPQNPSLERVASLSPRTEAPVAEPEMKRKSTAPGGSGASSTAAAAAAAAAVAKKKARTPSPQPVVPQSAPRTINTSVPATAASSSAAASPVMTTLTPSPQPLEPAAAAAGGGAGAKPLKDVTGKGNVRTPPPHSSAAQATNKAWSAPMNTHESPEYPPTDAPNVVVPARKFVYDVKTCTWKEIDTMIRVVHPNRGVSQGAMRVCFVVEELDERGFSSPMVAKMFRHNLQGIVEADYFNEGEAQCICGIFAEKYNKVEVPKEVDRFVISFLQCDTVHIRPRDLPEEYQNKRSGFFSYRTTDTRDVVFTMEPRLKGNFTKYTNNYGAVYEGFEQRLDREKEAKRHKVLMAAEAFSHFTLEDSGGSMLVCDLQGVNDFLTDPQIHTIDGKGFGMGNMGQRGIDKWVEKHVCNDMCRALKLTPLKDVVHPQRQLQPSSSIANVETRVSYYKILRSNLRSQAPTRPEDLIPLPKPLSEMTDDERLDYAIRLSSLLS